MYNLKTISSMMLLGTASVSAIPASYPNLVPLQPHPRSFYSIRDGGDDYKLSMDGTWYWNIGDSATAHAKADCSFSKNGEQPWNGRAIALERLMKNVAEVQCTDSSIELKWSDKNAFGSAQSNWDWVNQESDRYLALVVKTPNCAGGQRQVYKISTFKTDKDSFSMEMNAKAVDFADAFPYVDFKLSTSGIDSDYGVTKRFESSIPVAHDFSGTNIFSEDISDDVKVALTCGNCKTTGSFDINLDASFDATAIFKGKNPIHATLSIVPKGVSATVGLDLVVSADIKDAFSKSVTFINIPLLPSPLDVPGIATLGPALQVNLEAKIDSISGSVDLSLGSVTLSIDDSSKANLDFIGDQTSNQGFQPTFTTEGPKLSADVSISAHFGPNIVLGIDASLFGKGLAGGIALAAPQLAATASVGVDSSCGGVELDADLTAQLNAFAGAGDIAKVAAESTISIIGTSTQIFHTCLNAPTATATATGLTPFTVTNVPTTVPTGSFGEVLSDVGCQQALNSQSAGAPAPCAKDGGDPTFTQLVDGSSFCCSGGTGPVVIQGSMCCI
jgi:hypothetical protein